MELAEIIGTMAGICTTVAVIPQIHKALTTKEVGDISPKYFIILLTGVGLWLFYGIMKSDWPIIVTNAVTFLLNSAMLIIYFKRK